MPRIGTGVGVGLRSRRSVDSRRSASEGFIEALEEYCKRYEEVVNESALSPNSKPSYIGHAWQFVRWVRGEFEPGAHVD